MVWDEDGVEVKVMGHAESMLTVSIRGFMKRPYGKLSMMEPHRDSMMACVMQPKGALFSR